MNSGTPVGVWGVVLACNVSAPTPGSLTWYTIAAILPNVGRVELERQVPSYWRWPDTMDTNGSLLVGKPVRGAILDGVIYWDFIEPPHFKFCPGEEPAALVIIDPTTGLPMIPGEPPPSPGGPSTADKPPNPGTDNPPKVPA